MYHDIVSVSDSLTQAREHIGVELDGVYQASPIGQKSGQEPSSWPYLQDHVFLRRAGGNDSGGIRVFEEVLSEALFRRPLFGQRNLYLQRQAEEVAGVAGGEGGELLVFHAQSLRHEACRVHDILGHVPGAAHGLGT